MGIRNDKIFELASSRIVEYGHTNHSTLLLTMRQDTAYMHSVLIEPLSSRLTNNINLEFLDFAFVLISAKGRIM